MMLRVGCLSQFVNQVSVGHSVTVLSLVLGHENDQRLIGT